VTSTCGTGEITVHGQGRKTRTVKISHDAARSLDRYLRARARHAQAWRSQLWLGISNRGPMAASGIYQVIARRGRQCGIDVLPHRFRHHFSHAWLDRGGAEGDLMGLSGWASPQMLRRYGASARAARDRRSYDRVMDDRRNPGRLAPGWLATVPGQPARSGAATVLQSVTVGLKMVAREPPYGRSLDPVSAHVAPLANGRSGR
jgi:hypothetical protein